MSHRGRTAVGIAVLLAGVAQPLFAQSVRLAPDAQVKAIRYRFIGSHQLQPEQLNAELAMTAPGPFEGLQSAVAWIPFVPDPPQHAVDPLMIQSDLVRLRRLYRREGFLEAHVDYEVHLDRNRHHVEVTFTIDEGPPLAMRSLKLVDARARPDLGIGDSLYHTISSLTTRIENQNRGQRFSQKRIEAGATRLTTWFANHGYPAARTEPRAAIDSVAHQADLVWMVDAGGRVRLSNIEVSGVHSVPRSIVTRQLGIQPGDLAKRDELEKGRANLQSVPLFRRANVTLADGAIADTTMPLQVAITESRARLTNVELGYVTDGAGVTSQVRWTHPNFTGGARSLDAIGLVQTGWGTTSDVPDRLLRANLTLNQPYVGSPLLTLSVGPQAELRDGRIDKSTSYSGLATLVYRFNPLQSAALRYDFTYRHLIDLKVFGIEAGQVSNPTLLAFGDQGLIDSLTAPSRISEFVFFTSVGSLDDISRPRHGVVLKPNLAITFPRTWGNVEYGRADLQATNFWPMPGKGNALMFRGTFGAVWPFGDSAPAAGANPAYQWLRLRDEVLTAGGANDVRGYASELLGPKFPDVTATIENGDTTFASDRYVAIGGLRRVTASAEFRIGLPTFGKDIFAHLFADAGRVWTSDPRYQLSQIQPDDERMHYTTGGGIGYYTPVGAIRFDLGYKLNPSLYDLRKPQDVLDVALRGQPVSSAPVVSSRRYAFHLALGLYF